MTTTHKKETLAEKGILAEQYTQNNWFVKIYPAYGIGRVRFSFVMKGKNGEGFDIYIPIDKFDNWCDDILDKSLCQIIETEKANDVKYPEHYKHVTGEKAQKSIGFAPSTVKGYFVTINGKVYKDGKNIFANVPVDFYWLRTLAKKFRATSKKYYLEEAETILKVSSAYRQNFSDEDSDFQATEPSVPEKELVSENSIYEIPNATDANKTSSNSGTIDTRTDAIPEKTPAIGNNSSEKIAITVIGTESIMAVDSNSNLAPDGHGNYLMKVINSDKKVANFLLPASVAEKLGKDELNAFITSCNDSFSAGKHSHFKMKYKNGKYGKNKTAVYVFLGFETI